MSNHLQDIEQRLQVLEERTQRLLEVESRPWWHNEFAALSAALLVIMAAAIIGMLIFAI